MPVAAKGLASKAAILIVGLVAFAAGGFVVRAATPDQATSKTPLPAFQIVTRVSGQLAPGRTIRLKLKLANDRRAPLWVTRMTARIAVDRVHTAKGCSAKRDYVVRQLPRKFFPYRLGKGTRVGKRKLRLRGVPMKRSRGLPTIAMQNLPVTNQNACKGATLTISYATRSTLKKPRSKR